MIYTAPGKAAAMWQKYNRFTLKRHVGTGAETVSEFRINEFITDEYPDQRGNPGLDRANS